MYSKITMAGLGHHRQPIVCFVAIRDGEGGLTSIVAGSYGLQYYAPNCENVDTIAKNKRKNESFASYLNWF